MPKISLQQGEGENRITASAGSFQLELELGSGRRPRSIDFLLFAIGSCVIGTVRHYLLRKHLSTDCLRIDLSSELDEVNNCYEDIKITLQVDQSISAAQRSILSNVAKACRIHKTLERQPEIRIDVATAPDTRHRC